MRELGNHLWQSTLFTIAAAVFCRMLRNNRARVRYWIWLAASLKFLVPCALLISLGARLDKPAPSRVQAPVMSAIRVEQITRSFAPVPPAIPSASAARRDWRPPTMGAMWLAGAVWIAGRWWRRWAALRRLRRRATPIVLDFPVPVVVSPAAIEPGIFGLVRPVLLLPDGLMSRLDRQQLESILAHERCHVLARDNLTGALHMTMAAFFWFHPAVWWIGRRLLEERERACDEAVLRQGARPDTYAQGILSVCRFYATTPLPCASGVTGADLKKRIREIMTWRLCGRMTTARKLMLGGAGVAAACLPVMIGILRAQTLPPPPAYGYEVVSIHRSDPKETSSQLGPGPQGGMRTTNVTTMQLLTFAYDVRPHQIVGAPGWVGSERFDVSFTPDKPEAGVLPGPGGYQRLQSVFNRHRQRMQAVLRDRFGLVLRVETRELPMYALVIARGGPKLAPPADPSQGPNFTGSRGHLTAVSAYMKMLTDHLSSLVGRYVSNETGLNGPYDFKLDWTPDSAQLPNKVAVPDDPAPAEDGGTSIFTALTEQLGLRLESKKGPVPVYVVEKVERPGEN